MITLTTGEQVVALLTEATELTVHHAVVHPDAARALLDVNTRNRTVTQSRVAMLARSLRDGRWQLINNGIAVDSNGDLLDGQHRLHAIVLADTPAEVFLHVGLDPAARSVIDVGKARSMADTLAVHGYGSGRSTVAAAVGLLHRYTTDQCRPWGGSLPAQSHDEMLAYLATLDRHHLQRAEADAHTISTVVRGINRSALLATLYLAMSKDACDAAAFAVRLRTGEHLASGDPELTLRNTVGRVTGRRNDWHLCLYLKAWNARRAGRPVVALRYAADEKVPEVR